MNGKWISGHTKSSVKSTGLDGWWRFFIFTNFGRLGRKFSSVILFFSFTEETSWQRKPFTRVAFENDTFENERLSLKGKSGRIADIKSIWIRGDMERVSFSCSISSLLLCDMSEKSVKWDDFAISLKSSSPPPKSDMRLSLN